MMPRTATGLRADKLKALARKGAEHALNQLRAEIIAIERAFPELRHARGRRSLRYSVHMAARRTQRWSAAARKAVSRRMKRYWAERRKAKAKLR